MAARRTNCADQALACDIFDKFCNSSTSQEILSLYAELCRVCKISPTNFHEFYPKLKAKIPSWRAGELWSKFEKKAAEKQYARGKHCSETRVLIIGAGPCGLRAAIETQLLGARTVLIEKRPGFSRNNVLHLWPFTITDLRNLGAKSFYGRFCAGSIDHISIRQLQCILLKIALLLGVEIHTSVSFEGLIEPRDESDLGWKASTLPTDHPVAHFNFDVIIGADGRRNSLPGFKRKALRAKLAIAITANFVNHHSEAEARVQEISGVSYIFKQEFFQDLEEAMGIALENIVYYKDETHYFVMTPTKQSLLEKGVLYKDFSDPEMLLSPENVDYEVLQLFTMQAVVFATDNKLPDLQFALNYRGEPDLALFDFTTMYASENACRVLQRKGHKLLMGLVGDSLLEPFWPTGSGLGRGFLGAFDAAWMIRSWGKGLKSVCEVLAERESIHRLLAQTTQENLNKDHNQYSIDPATRYPNINLGAVSARLVRALYDTDEAVKDIFISLREDRNSKQVPVELLFSWFKNQLSSENVEVKDILEIFTMGEALYAILNRFRPDLIDFPMPSKHIINPEVINQHCFEVLLEEYEIPILMSGQESIQCAEVNRQTVTEYLSYVYNAFKGEIPRSVDPQVRTGEADPQNEKTEGEKISVAVYPNNSALHHSLSIKQFLEAKETLKEKKALEESQSQSRRERRRSQFYESIMQSESNYNQQRSTSCANIPVVKLNPVPPGELFSACRNGSDRESSGKNKNDPSPSPPSTAAPPLLSKLQRSRSDLCQRTSGQGPSFRKLQSHSELEEIQHRIRKSRLTPLGDIMSTFLGKHINQNESCSYANGKADANPLSTERRHLRPSRPVSMYLNANEWPSRYGMEDQENDEEQRDNGNPFFTSKPEQDVGFKERCKFLEKNLYNSGREFKVHLGAPWFSPEKMMEDKKETKRNDGSGTGVSNPLQRSRSSCLTTGFHPLKRGNSAAAINARVEEPSRKGISPKAVFLGKRLGEMVDRHVPLELRLRQKSSSTSSENATTLAAHNHSPLEQADPDSTHEQEWQNNHPSSKLDHDQLNKNQQPNGFQQQYHYHKPKGSTPADVKTAQANKTRWQIRKKLLESSSPGSCPSGNDSDLDCFLNTIDFTSIDGQDLQELLSSY